MENHSARVAPVRWRDRWIDDHDPIELWNDDRSLGLSMTIASAADDEPNLAELDVWRIPTGDDGFASLIVDLASGELRGQPADAGTLAPPLDAAWLRDRLDDELRAALRQRLDREPRASDPHDWRTGDAPRVALGEHAAFAQVFPAAWDLVVTHRGRRYALIDSHRVAPGAEHGPVAIEVVDLETGETVGTAEVDLAAARKPHTGRRKVRFWRTSAAAVDPVLQPFMDDPDRWFKLVDRAETIARTALVMETWDSDVRNPGAVVNALLAEPDKEAVPMLRYRVKALGGRCVPALCQALDAPDGVTARYAARLLAELGDGSGRDRLIAALGDPAFDDDHEDSFTIARAIAALGKQAIEPLLAAFAGAQDPTARDRLVDALTAIEGPHDDRIREVLVSLVRNEPRRAGLLGDYGDRSPAVVGLLVELLEAQLDVVRANPDDADPFGVASELAVALADLGVHGGPVEQFFAISRARREARLAELRASRRPLEPRPMEPTPSKPPPVPVQVAQRPGRNDPCWCGSAKKYKKCHLEADDETRTR